MKRKHTARVRISTGAHAGLARWVEINVKAWTAYGLGRKIGRLKVL